MKAPVDKLFVELARDVGKLPDPILREILPALKQAQSEIAAGLRKWMATHDASARFTPAHYRSVLVQLETAMRSIERLSPTVSKALRDGTERAARLAVRHLVRESTELAAIHGTEVPVLAWDVAKILADTRRTTGPRATVYGSKVANLTAADIRRQLLIGVMKGETFHQTTARMASGYGPPTADGAARAIGTRAWNRTNRIVRTEMIAAYNEAADRGIEAAADGDPSFMRLWSAASDRRMCFICAPLDGKTATVKGAFPGGYDRPPAHPYCRCSVCMWHRDWDERATAPAAEPEPVTLAPPPPPQPLVEATAAVRAGGELAPVHQSAIRTALRKVFSAEGMISRDVGLSEGQAFAFFDGPGYAFHGWSGKIRVAETLRAAVADALDILAGGTAKGKGEGALRVILHEEAHGHSPIKGSVYMGPAAKIEEVTTEVTARRLARAYMTLPRDLGYEMGVGTFAAKNAAPIVFTGGSYGEEIADVLMHLQAVTGSQDIDHLAKLLETASTKLKGAGPTHTEPEHYLRAFADKFDLPKSQRDAFYERISKDTAGWQGR